MKLKTNDIIQVISGDDKGRSGKITKVFLKENKVLVDGINTYKKHVKPQGEQKGGVLTLSRPIQISKVALLCPNCKKPSRIKYSGEGKNKVRVCVKCNKPITTQATKKSKK
jgi:large subunit ribosomal protein L24